jgi:hypothetical protein
LAAVGKPDGMPATSVDGVCITVSAVVIDNSVSVVICRDEVFMLLIDVNGVGNLAGTGSIVFVVGDVTVIGVVRVEVGFIVIDDTGCDDFVGVALFWFVGIVDLDGLAMNCADVDLIVEVAVVNNGADTVGGADVIVETFVLLFGIKIVAFGES